MKLIYHLPQVNRSVQKLVGGKAFALATMAQKELPIPKTICISTNAYNIFMDETGLRAKVLMEYHRKSCDKMRWEEMWDCSLRIQNMFINTPIPSKLAAHLKKEISNLFGTKAVAVRSSAIVRSFQSADFPPFIKPIRETLFTMELLWP